MSGTPTAFPGTTNLGATPRVLGNWFGQLSSQNEVLSEFAGPSTIMAGSLWPIFGGNLGSQNAPPKFDFELIWCDAISPCKDLPDTNQNISYDIRANDLPHNITHLNNSQVGIIKSTALNALRTAFSSYNVTVATGRQGTNTAYIIGDQPAIACGGTEGNNVAVSRIYYPGNMSQAQYAVNITNGNPSNTLLQAIGEGIGNNAAHEIAHQLKNRFSSKVVGGFGLDDTSIDTYNSGSCDGSNASWVFTGIGTDTNKTPIHWEQGNADVSLMNILGKKQN